MKSRIGHTLFIATLALVLGPFVARAQGFPDCGTCPTLSCDETCQYCDGIESPDGGCSNFAYKSCMDTGACIKPGCTSSWNQTSSIVRGTYGVNLYFYCEHHKVSWTTEADANQCNISSYFWTRSSCVDITDYYKIQTGNADCCDGHSPFVCDHHHSC